MPATAGRVRMPANNRVHSSAALQTHGIWQSAIGYDPYAPNKEEKNNKVSEKSAADEPETENAYTSFQGLLALARVTGSNADEARGACQKCGRVGHLTFQCRNFLSIKEDGDKDKDAEAIQAAVLSGLEKLKGERMKARGEDASESEEEESESSDSDYDSEMERAVAEKYGKSISDGKLSSKSRKRYGGDESDDAGAENKSKERRRRERKERGRSKKRSSKRATGDSEDEDEGRRRRRRKEKRRRRGDDLSNNDEERRPRKRKTRKEKHRRRSHSDSDDDSSDDSAEHRHKRRRRRSYSGSDTDGSGSDDPRVGRHKKRSSKKRRSRHHKED